MRTSLRSLGVPHQTWPAVLRLLTPAEAAPAARYLVSWISSHVAANTRPAPQCCSSGIAAGAAEWQPQGVERCLSQRSADTGLSSSSSVSEPPVTETPPVTRRSLATGRWRRGYEWWPDDALRVAAPVAPQHVGAITSSSALPSSTNLPSGPFCALQPYKSWSPSSDRSRGMATEAGSQLLDSSGRPLASQRRAQKFEQAAGDATERTDPQQRQAEPQRGPSDVAEPADDQQMVAIDRAGLRSLPEHERGDQPHKGPQTPLLRHLKALIRVRPGNSHESSSTCVNSVHPYVLS